MHQTLKNSILERLRNEALYQLRPSLGIIDDIPINLQSMLLANQKREALNSWPQNLAFSQAELQLARANDLYGQLKPATLLEQKDRLAARLYDDMRIQPTGGVPDYTQNRSGMPSTMHQLKNVGNFTNSQHLPSINSQNANNPIKSSQNKQKSDKIAINSQKELKNNFSANKKQEFIVIDEEPEEQTAQVPELKEQSQTGRSIQVVKKDQPSQSLKGNKESDIKPESSNNKLTPAKKSENTKSNYGEKIQNLLKAQNASSFDFPPATSANISLSNDQPSLTSRNSLAYGSHLPSEYAGQLGQLRLPLQSYPSTMQRGSIDIESILMLQALSQNLQNQSLNSNFSAYYLEKFILQQQQIQEMQRMAQLANFSLNNPLLPENEQPIQTVHSDQEKVKQFAFAREKEDKKAPERTKKEAIQVIDLDDDDISEDNQAAMGNRVEKRLCREDKSQKKVFHIVKNVPRSKKSDNRSPTITQSPVKEVAKRIVRKEKVGLSTSLVLKKTRSSLMKDLDSKTNQLVSLDGNLEQQNKRNYAASRSVRSLLGTERLATKERKKNKLQLMAEERDNLVNAFKNLNEKNEEELELENVDSEEEYASLCNYPNPLKRIKPIRIGSNYQAIVPQLELNQREETKPRKFKSVWNPSKLGDEKTQDFMSEVKTIINKDTYHEDFLLRLLSKNHMDVEKTLNVIETNDEYFANLFKQKRSFNPLRRPVQEIESTGS